MEPTVVVAGPPRRNRLTGQVILVVLLLTFPLLAWLVWEQGRVIDAQRLLIQQLSYDSQQLNAIRMRELQNRAKAGTPADKPADQQQPGKPQQPAAPEHKNRKHLHSRQAPSPPPPPQEYPATRPIPARKGA